MRTIILLFLALICSYSIASAQIPSWHALDGPTMQGGIFYDFVQKPDGTIFTTSEVNGVYRSTDDGKSWKQCIKGLRNCEGVSLALSPKGTLFCSNINAGLQPNIYRSLNNGDTWEEITISVQSTRTFAPRHIYCAAKHGKLKPME
ncbi:MAG: exo-alpha-sialidase [Ignavibacteria bacterium]|nr:exo-alpha-sialidase [Ignavibacteria bacterium]